MREICDKHFPDNWVIPIYGGILYDLEFSWQSFPAANKALKNNIVEDKVRYLAEINVQNLDKISKKLKKYIIDGQLQEKEALDNVKNLSNLLREANSTIRWIMLHQNCSNSKFKEIVSSNVDREKLVQHIMDLSKFENLLKELLTLIVTKKQ